MSGNENTARSPAFKAFYLFIFCLATPTSTAAQKNPNFELYGIGRYSCAKWLSTAESHQAGINWIAGYWSGLNLLNTQDKLVGSRSDWEAIVGEIQKICVSEPSTLLATSAGRVYAQYQNDNK